MAFEVSPFLFFMATLLLNILPIIGVAAYFGNRNYTNTPEFTTKMQFLLLFL